MKTSLPGRSGAAGESSAVARQQSGPSLADDQRPSTQVAQVSRRWPWTWVVPLAVLALVCGLAQFSFAAWMGLYEDDYFFIGYAMGDDGTYVLNRIANVLNWPQGRPIGFLLPPLLAYVGDQVAGLAGIYALAYLVVVLNAALFFALLRMRTSLAVALLGALFFLLYPGDTTKMLLTHSFQLQPSLTFLTLGSILYLKGMRLPAYMVAAGSLIAYESAFMPFFAVPLLRREWDRRLIREWAIHILALVGIMAAAVAIRLLFGEQRVASSTAGVVDLLRPFLGSIALGPLRSLLLFVYGPLLSLQFWTWVNVLLALASAGLALGGALWLTRVGEARAHGNQSLLDAAPSDSGNTVAAWWIDPARLLVAGLVMLPLAYALAFTHFPPNAVTGRGTSVHLASTFASSIAFSGLVGLVLAFARHGVARLAALAAIAAYLFVLVGYQVAIQRDYVRSWEHQRWFWTRVVELAPDLDEGTTLLYRTDDPQRTRYIDTHSWSDALVLEQAFDIPPGWSQPPRLFTLGPEWTDRISVEGDTVWWLMPAGSWDEHWAVLPERNVIYLEFVDGEIRRHTGDLAVPGGSISLKPAPSSNEPSLLSGPLHGYLIQP